MVVNSTQRMQQRFRERQDMNAVNLPLPENILTNVKEFASDKLSAHPTAQLIKELEFQYKPEENKYGWGSTDQIDLRYLRTAHALIDPQIRYHQGRISHLS